MEALCYHGTQARWPPADVRLAETEVTSSSIASTTAGLQENNVSSADMMAVVEYKVVRIVRTEHGHAVNNMDMPSLAAARAHVAAHGGVLWSYCRKHGWAPGELCSGRPK